MVQIVVIILDYNFYPRIEKKDYKIVIGFISQYRQYEFKKAHLKFLTSKS